MENMVTWNNLFQLIQMMISLTTLIIVIFQNNKKLYIPPVINEKQGKAIPYIPFSTAVSQNTAE